MGEFARALVVFFAIIDPVGNLLVFQALTRDMGLRPRLTAALLSTAVAFGILTLFALSGTALLDYLGISLASFEVSAGLLLGITAIRVVDRGEPLPASAEPASSPLGVVVVPLATPLLAGPAAIATTVSFTHLTGRATTITAVAAILAMTVAVFLAGSWLFERTARPVLPVLARIVGILLTAIAVNLVLDGLRAFFA